MQQKKILIHAPYLNTPGGKQTYYTAVEGFYKSDVSFFFYGANGQKESRVKTSIRVLKDYLNFYKQIKQNKFDIVHLNPSLNFKSFFRDSIFSLICRLVGVKTIVFWHGWNWDFERKTIQKIKPYFRWTFGKVDAMIVLAKEFETQLRSYGYKRKIYLETTVVDKTILDYVDTVEQAPIMDKSLTFLFLARLEKPKGLYEVIDSFGELRKKHPNIKLDIAGTGSESKKAMEYVEQQNIQDVNFLGWISGEDKAQELFYADVYILASYTEGMPISLLEAMTAGSAIVTTDVGGIKDFFQNGQMGYVVPVKNRKKLQQKLEDLITHPMRIEQMGHYNASYAKKRFTPSQVANRMESIYTTIHKQSKQKDFSFSIMTDTLSGLD